MVFSLVLHTQMKLQGKHFPTISILIIKCVYTVQIIVVNYRDIMSEQNTTLS